MMRQIAERMVRRGHDVTVATTRLVERTSYVHNGVKIKEFGISGNLARGMEGELGLYREFVKGFECDAILIKAAQQWTFDALWPVLDEINARKVFIPCGFSGLFEPIYVDYFEKLPDVLRKFDHLIFYAEHYRDVDFAREHALTNFSILPNGASEIEFNVKLDPAFRARHDIPEHSTVLLTVGSITGVKGHKELLEAFARLNTKGQHVTFIMNGNEPPKPVVTIYEFVETQETIGAPVDFDHVELSRKNVFVRMVGVFQSEGLDGITKRLSTRWKNLSGRYARVKNFLFQIGYVFRTEGLLGIRTRIMLRFGPRLAQSKYFERMPKSVRAMANPMAFWMAEVIKSPVNKLLIKSDFPRAELVQAYKAANLFVFASNVEYSPLVLFETVAAGTPFLSVPVGNAEEIANWTGGGFICPAEKDERGYTRVDPALLASQIEMLIANPDLLAEKGKHGYLAWKDKFTWDAIAVRYEEILSDKSVALKESFTCEPA